MRTILAATAALSFVGAAASATTVAYDFDGVGDITLSPTQAPGTWYTDRYAPGVFASGQTGGGRMGVLHHGLREADSAANRPGSFSSTFYDTQGRKHDLGLTGPVQRMAIDLFIDASSTDRISAGIWGTGINAANQISAYPILSYRQSDDNSYDSGFYFFDSQQQFIPGGGWLEVLTTGVSAASWNELEIVFTVGVGYEILINGMSEFTYADTTTVSLDNVILNAYNFGVDQNIYWDNFVASDDGTAIPLPTAGGLAMAGLLTLGARRRRAA